MADIINSSSYNGKVLQTEFKKSTEFINKKLKNKLLSPLTITLGDEFQGITKNLRSCLELIFEFEEYIIKNSYSFKLRYVVKFGSIETPINHEVAYGMMGDGLSSARKMLEIQKKSDIRFEFEVGNTKRNIALNNAFYVLQSIQSKWQIEDYKHVTLFLEYIDYKIIADKTGISRSQIWKKEKSLNISSYFAIKNVIFYLSR